MNARLVKILCLSSILLNGILIWVSWPHLASKISTVKHESTRAIPAVKVRIAKVKQEPISRKRTVAGIIKAIDAVSLMSETIGKVVKIHFQEGDKVKRGDVLIQLDDAQAKAELAEAEARVKLAEAEYKRQKVLFEKKYTSRAALEKAEANRTAALAEREKALINLKHTRVTAPFDGEVGLFSISVGSQIRPDQEITRIVRSHPMIVEFQVPESEVKDIHVGQEIDVLAERYDNLPVTAVIKAKEPYADPITHNTRVRAILDNKEGKFRDGAFASVTLSLSSDENARIVPKEAVFRERDQDFVYVIAQNKAHQRHVIVGAEESDRVQITDGLELGEVVATDPIELLIDGIPVTIDTSE